MYEKLDVKKIEEFFSNDYHLLPKIYLKCDIKYNSKILYYLML